MNTVCTTGTANSIAVNLDVNGAISVVLADFIWDSTSEIIVVQPQMIHHGQH